MVGTAERPVTVPDAEREDVVALDRLMESTQHEAFQIVLNGRCFTVPATVREAFHLLLQALATSGAVAVIPVERLLRTQAAADMLNVSRPYLTKLLDRGDIPCRYVGNQRRVRLEDVLAYKAQRDANRNAALNGLIAASQEYGLYDEA